jgi:hypothetical protein
MDANLLGSEFGPGGEVACIDGVTPGRDGRGEKRGMVECNAVGDGTCEGGGD